ncbi:MAG: SRPBCC family protein [Planctomycetaceae bacterium]
MVQIHSNRSGSNASVKKVVQFGHTEDGTPVLRTRQVVPAELPDVFNFFGDASQLQRLTPPWLHFRITTPMPIEIGEGTLIDYRLRLRFIPIKWRTLISEWVPNQRFVDEQLKGPYRLWHHTHEFQPVEDGTLVTDTVRYRVPGGSLVEKLFVRNDLRRIFEYRYAALERIFVEG